MSTQNPLKLLVKEAELYKTQGLLELSRARYLKVLQLAERSKPSLKRQKVIRAIRGKIKDVEKEIESVNEECPTPELSGDVHSLIKKLFSFSKTKVAADVEAAIALAKFGQYEQALEEFGKLLPKEKCTLIAAKNILRCHISLASPEAALAQLETWIAGDSPMMREHLLKLRIFLADLLKGTGKAMKLPQIAQEPPVPEETVQKEPMDWLPETDAVGEDHTGADTAEKPDGVNGAEPDEAYFDVAALGLEEDGPGREEGSEEQDDSMEDVLDISSVKIRFSDGPMEGKTVELSVTFQVGNVVSLIFPSKKKTLLKFFPTDAELPDITIKSSSTEFSGKAKILGRLDIQSGPNKGDTMLDIIVYAA